MENKPAKIKLTNKLLKQQLSELWKNAPSGSPKPEFSERDTESMMLGVRQTIRFK